jgi:hypothetical protein
MPPARHARRLRLEPLESRALPSFSPVATYPTAAHESVAVAVGDFNGDGTPDILTAPGGAGGARVKAFDGATGSLLNDFAAYDTDIAGGLFVTAP